MTTFTINARANNGAAGVTNPDNAHNGYKGDYAAVQAATDFDTQFVIDNWIADPDADGRGTVTLYLTMRYNEYSTTNSKIRVFFRPTSGDSWTQLDSDDRGSSPQWAVAPTAANTRSFTISPGTDPATGWEVGVQVFTGTGSIPTFNPA